ncbi:winged helix-turn-helix transcriptional regulator [Streptomyces californicus]|uniref:winged helix-turn-helix transcriptional regulator n=1 Tax=Streptomyces californicus TaxID=67351 RepID=UPI0037AD896C
MSGGLLSNAGGPPAGPSPQAGPKARVPDCPLARAVGVIGPWWTLEILHEVLDGRDRFDGIRRNLGMSAAVLQDRLDQLVARGLLEAGDPAGTGRTRPEERRYAPTDGGRALRPLILVMAAYGNHRLGPDDRSLIVVDAVTGAEAQPVVVDRQSGRRLDTAGFRFAPGPRASEAISARYPRAPKQR